MRGHFVLVCILICGGCNVSVDRTKTVSSLTEPVIESVVVRIPPSQDPQLSPGENHCVFSIWWQDKNFERNNAVSACQGAVLPNDGIPLIVNLETDGALTLNSETNGVLTEPVKLTERLREVFKQREEHQVLANDGDGVERSVALIAKGETKFMDVVRLAVIVKQSGATPIMLPIDGILHPQIVTRDTQPNSQVRK